MARIDFVTGNAQQYLPEVEALARVPDRAEAALAGRSSADLRQPPAEGEWPAARVLQHMTFYAREIGHNLHRMIWQEAPQMTIWDEDELIASEGWDDLDGPALLEALTEAFAALTELLKELPDASWGRPGMHPRAGYVSIRQLVRSQMRHFDRHLEQLEQALA